MYRIESAITYQEQDSKPIDALQYVLSVKNTFGENAEEYLHFLALLNDFRANRSLSLLIVFYFFLVGSV